MKVFSQLVLGLIVTLGLVTNADASAEGYKKASKYMLASHHEKHSGQKAQKRKVASTKKSKKKKSKKKKKSSD